MASAVAALVSAIVAIYALNAAARQEEATYRTNLYLTQVAGWRHLRTLITEFENAKVTNDATLLDYAFSAPLYPDLDKYRNELNDFSNYLYHLIIRLKREKDEIDLAMPREFDRLLQVEIDSIGVINMDAAKYSGEDDPNKVAQVFGLHYTEFSFIDDDFIACIRAPFVKGLPLTDENLKNCKLGYEKLDK